MNSNLWVTPMLDNFCYFMISRLEILLRISALSDTFAREISALLGAWIFEIEHFSFHKNKTAVNIDRIFKCLDTLQEKESVSKSLVGM